MSNPNFKQANQELYNCSDIAYSAIIFIQSVKNPEDKTEYSLLTIFEQIFRSISDHAGNASEYLENFR